MIRAEHEKNWADKQTVGNECRKTISNMRKYSPFPMASDFDERVTPSNRVDVICYGYASSPHVNMILSIQRKDEQHHEIGKKKNIYNKYSFVERVGTTQL